MSKHKILFAWSLKPAFDIRVEKLYQSFQNDSTYECSFCGVHSETNNENLKKYTWNYKRSLLFRLIINIKYFLLLLKTRPNIILINTNDIALISIFYKNIFSCKLIYDVQENFVNNITYQNIYIGIRKKLYIFILHLSNKLLAKYCTGFILAESCYADELNFIKTKPNIVLQNKFLVRNAMKRKKEKSTPLQLLFSGTISQTSGIEYALLYLRKLNQLLPCELTIIGHTPDLTLHEKLKTLQNKTIKYKGSSSPIPYIQIEQARSQADFGLICYEITPANTNKIPTKLYEYLANELPIICQEHKKWNNLIKDYGGGIIFRESIQKRDLQKEFYTKSADNNIVWNKEPLIKWFNKI